MAGKHAYTLPCVIAVCMTIYLAPKIEFLHGRFTNYSMGFDAVSAKRCYRDALPLEECYSIIRKGRGTDFDPDIVDAFMMDLDQVEKIYYNQLR